MNDADDKAAQKAAALHAQGIPFEVRGKMQHGVLGDLEVEAQRREDEAIFAETSAVTLPSTSDLDPSIEKRLVYFVTHVLRDAGQLPEGTTMLQGSIVHTRGASVATLTLITLHKPAVTGEEQR